MAIRVVNLIGEGKIVKNLLTLRIDYFLSSVMGERMCNFATLYLNVVMR